MAKIAAAYRLRTQTTGSSGERPGGTLKYYYRAA
jgi:hypothetical protein